MSGHPFARGDDYPYRIVFSTMHGVIHGWIWAPSVRAAKYRLDNELGGAGFKMISIHVDPSGYAPHPTEGGYFVRDLRHGNRGRATRRSTHGDTKVRYTEFVARAVAIYMKRGVTRAEAERLTAKRYGLSVREVQSICASMRSHGNASKKKYPLNTYEKHQLKIARATLRMPDAMVGVMGGMTKADARWTILVLGQKLSKAEK